MFCAWAEGHDDDFWIEYLLTPAKIDRFFMTPDYSHIKYGLFLTRVVALPPSKRALKKCSRLSSKDASSLTAKRGALAKKGGASLEDTTPFGTSSSTPASPNRNVLCFGHDDDFWTEYLLTPVRVLSCFRGNF